LMNSISCISTEKSSRRLLALISKLWKKILVKFRRIVAERRDEHYAEIGEGAARQLKMKKILGQMERDGVCVEDLLLDFH